MTTHTKNLCTPATHDFAPSLTEPGLLACQWPGCRETTEASAEPVPGVDVPGPALRDAAREREAA